jgi:hypothetical protein
MAGDARIVDAGGRRQLAAAPGQMPEPEPEDAAVLRLLEYMRGMAAAADGPQPAGAAGDMDAVVESLAGRGGAAEEVEAWARSRSC